MNTLFCLVWLNQQQYTARNSIADKIKTDLNIYVTENQVAKSFSNKKSRLLETTVKRTGNIDPDLTEAEKTFESFLNGGGGDNAETSSGLPSGRLSFRAGAQTPAAGSSSYYIPPQIQQLDEEVAVINSQSDVLNLDLNPGTNSSSPASMMLGLSVASSGSKLL